MNIAALDLPDAVLGFLAVHHGLRVEAAGIASLVADGHRDRARRRAEVLGRVLGEHHRVEDELLWPAIGARTPGFSLSGAAFEQQHERLDTELDALPGDPARIELVAPLLEDHLREEEAVALPVWLGSFGPADHERFDRRMRTSTPTAEIGLMVSWLLDVTPEALREMAFGKMPAPLRVAHRTFWRRSYERSYGRAVVPADGELMLQQIG